MTKAEIMKRSPRYFGRLKVIDTGQGGLYKEYSVVNMDIKGHEHVLSSHPTRKQATEYKRFYGSDEHVENLRAFYKRMGDKA